MCAYQFEEMVYMLKKRNVMTEISITMMDVQQHV